MNFEEVNKKIESLEVEKVSDLLKLKGKEFYPKSILVDQNMVNDFADATGDHNPVHLNTESAEKSIFGQAVAHGMLTASLAAHEKNIWSIVKIKQPFELIANSMNIEWKRPCPVGSHVEYKFLLSNALSVKIKEKEGVETTWKVTTFINNKSIMEINWIITYIVQ